MSLGFLVLDILDNLVIDYILAVLTIAPTSWILLQVVGFFTYVLDYSSLGLALLLDW
jgi:hypothetical protein